jgi:hypothetical protein
MAAVSNHENIFQLPISTLTNDANDRGQPLCLSRPTEASEELTTFYHLAQAVSKEILLLHYDHQPEGTATAPAFVTLEGHSERFDLSTLQLSVDKFKPDCFTLRLFSETGATQVLISASNLRGRDPKTGENQNPSDEEETKPLTSTDNMVHVHKHGSPKLFPATVDKKGKYGYAVTWADGATIIYSRLSIAKAAGGSTSQ